GETPPRRYLAPPPDNQAYGYEMPIELRIGLGQLATDKQRLPAAWALAWALADHSIGKRTPVSRCQDAFATLFKIKYEQLHGEGMV
ncbi:TerB N-terminal domain-containing protein, partial [Pseudomonas paraeruginosa]